MNDTEKLKIIVKDEQKLIELIKRSKSKQEVLRQLNIHPKNSNVLKLLRQFYKDHRLDESHSIRYNYSKELLKRCVEESYSWSNTLSLLGVKNQGSNYLTVKKYCDFYDIDYSHFNPSLAAKIKRTPLIDNKVLIENSKVHRSTLKRYILSNNLLEYRCQECSNMGIWNNSPLTLQIDHINGTNDDNRIENLQFLCPNCHSQTQTFSGKNKSRSLEQSVL